jgi:hypothetical protein
LGIKAKPKSVKRKYEGTNVSMPAPPSKKVLAELDSSMVESGKLKIGIPCVPVNIEKRVKGKTKTTVAHSRKFTLTDIRQRLLKRHDKFMRLHSTSEIAAMCHNDLVCILKVLPNIDVSTKSTEELRQLLAHHESKRSLWIWHDHSSLASHGIIAVMVGVVYDPVLFFTESESQGVQEFVEEGEIHFIAHGSSSLADQACIIPERLAELEGLDEPLCTSEGVHVFDTLKYFKGDKPAAEFEAGISCGGNFPCVGCACSASRFSDFAHATSCEQRSLKRNQEVALGGQFGNKPGMLKFYDNLSKDELRRELEARGVKDYPTTRKGREDTLKGILHGVQRVPSLLMFSPESSLDDLHLHEYEVLPFEPLHDLKGYLGSTLRKLPSVIQDGRLKRDVSTYLDSVWKKAHLYGSDLREALIEVAYLFVNSPETAATNTVRKYVICLVEISKILYSLDESRSPKQCLQFYNCAFMVHEFHLELFGSAMTTQYFHALLLHGPQQHEVVCSRSVNAESEERLFKSAANAAKCTDRKPENMLPNVLKRLQVKRESKAGPVHSIHEQNSRIGKRAADLPKYTGTVFVPEWVKKRPFAWQAHLKRIAHFLIQGKGAWWSTPEASNIYFHDGESHDDCHPNGPHVLHTCSSRLGDVVVRSTKCWDACISIGVDMPIESVRLYSSNGDLVSVHPVQPIVESMDISLNASIPSGACLVPPLASTPVHASVVSDPPDLQVSPLPPPVVSNDESNEEVQSDNGTDDISNDQDEGGFVNMQVSDTVQDTPSKYTSTVCQSLAKLLGHSPELTEFDKVRMSAKSRTVKFPSELHKHKKLARYFRKLVSRHKVHLEQLLDKGPVEPSTTVQNTNDLKLCLKLICNLH